MPAKDGGCIATLAISEGLLAAEVELKILTIATPKHPFQPEFIPKEFAAKTQIESVFIDTDIKPIPAFLNLFSKKSYNVERFYSLDFNSRLIEILAKQQFDVVLMEGLYCMPYINTIRDKSKAKIVLRAHNIEHEIWEQLSNMEPNFLKKSYYRLLAGRLKTYEVEAMNQVDGIAAITLKDSIQIAQFTKVPVEIIQVGLKIKPETSSAFGQNCLFIGSMEWLPNVEGVEWFLAKIWPKVLKELPDAKFYLAGKAMPESLNSRKDKGLQNFGQIENVTEFWGKSGILVAPLFSGGGLKVKVVEAMMMGKVVITTPIGTEGINAENGKHLFICEDENSFLQTLLNLLKNPNLQTTIGHNAATYAAEVFGQEEVSRKLIDFFEEISAFQ